MAKEKLKKEQTNFTQIKNNVLQDKNLSLKAKGLYALIYSKPEDWDFSVERLSQESKEEFDATNSAIKELEYFGYLERVKKSNGKKEWNIYLNSQLGKKPGRENPNLGKSQVGKIPTISNKEEESNKEKESNKEVANQDLLPYEDLISKYLEIKDIKNKTNQNYIRKLKSFCNNDISNLEFLLKAIEYFSFSEYPYVIYSIQSLYEKKDKILARIKQEKIRLNNTGMSEEERKIVNSVKYKN